MAELRVDINHINTNTTFQIDKSNISSVSSLSQCLNDYGQLSYGMIASSGSVDIYDSKSTLKNFLLDKVVDASVDRFRIDIYLNNKCIQKHMSSQSEYDTSDSTLSMQLTGSVDALSKKNYSEGFFSTFSPTLKSFFVKILKDIGCSEDNINTMLAKKYSYFAEKEPVTLDTVLTSTVYDAIYVDTGNYAEILENICEIAQINLLYNDDNEMDFVVARPVMHYTTFSSSAVKIPSEAIMQDLSYSILNHNAIDGVKIPTVASGTDIFPFNTDELYFTETDYINVSRDEDAKKLIPSSDYSDKYSFEYIETSNTYGSYLITKFTSPVNLVDERYGYINLTAEPWFSATYDTIDYSSLASASYSTKTTSGELTGYDSYEDFKSYIQTLADNISYSSLSGLSNVSPLVVGYSGSISTDNGISEYWIASFGLKKNLSSSSSGLLQLKRPVTNIKVSFGGPAEMSYISDSTTYLYGRSEDASNNFYTFERNTLITDSVRCKIDDYLGHAIATPMSTGSTSVVLEDYPYSKDIIAENILSDYKTDVIVGTIEVACMDYYNLSNEKVINFKNGEILQLGQIIYIPNTAFKTSDGIERISGYWRIISRQMDYSGGPTLKLTILSLKTIGEVSTGGSSSSGGVVLM